LSSVANSATVVLDISCVTFSSAEQARRALRNHH